MSADIFPLRVLILALTGWVHHQQTQAIEYFVEENRALKEQLGGRRLRFALARSGLQASDGAREALYAAAA